MRSSAASSKDIDKRILVLAVDVDNDLYRKTKISGPLYGRVENLNGATQLALADPEDPDSNTIFQAVKIYDELKEEGYQVNVATITGSENEGYQSDSEISRQLDLVLSRYKSDTCVFVTDGASDNRILPIIQSRIKINSVKLLSMKQSEKLENTYFAILEKLKEPHYARIIFGIPAVLILLFALSYIFGFGLMLPAILIGIYLLVKGFGLEDPFLDSFRGFGFSIDRSSFVFYLGTLLFIGASLFVGWNNYLLEIGISGNSSLAWAYGIEGFLLLLPIALLLYLFGRIIDLRGKHYFFRSFRYGSYMGSSIIFWVLAYSFVAWIIGQIYFSQLLMYLILAIFIGVGISTISNFFRNKALRSRKLKDKFVINELGALIGKVGGTDTKHGRFTINTNFGNPITYSIDRIVEVSDKVIIK